VSGRQEQTLTITILTLHRLGIQAFQPILVEGRAICSHPEVRRGSNAFPDWRGHFWRRNYAFLGSKSLRL